MATTETRMLLLGAVAIFEPVNGYQIRRELLTWGVVDTTWAIMNISTSLIFMAIINWRLALIVSTIIPIMVYIAIQFRKKILVEYRVTRRTNSNAPVHSGPVPLPRGMLGIADPNIIECDCTGARRRHAGRCALARAQRHVARRDQFRQRGARPA